MNTTYRLAACFLLTICNACNDKDPTTASKNIEPAYPPVSIPRSEIHRIDSKTLGRSYNLFINVPYDYEDSDDRLYPVVFMEDGAYSFQITTALAHRLYFIESYEQMIFVGISYSLGDNPTLSRSRDYTPTKRLNANTGKDRAARAHKAFEEHSGGAKQYHQFLANEVIPYVQKHFRIDPNHKAHAGHSYGGLFSAYMLATAPETFNYYIPMSASLWYDDHVLFKLEQKYAKDHKDLNANAYFIIGEYEKSNLKNMVTDQHKFVKQLRSRNYTGLHIESHVVPEDWHLTVQPTAMIRALLWMSKRYRKAKNHSSTTLKPTPEAK